MASGQTVSGFSDIVGTLTGSSKIKALFVEVVFFGILFEGKFKGLNKEFRNSKLPNSSTNPETVNDSLHACAEEISVCLAGCTLTGVFFSDFIFRVLDTLFGVPEFDLETGVFLDAFRALDFVFGVVFAGVSLKNESSPFQIGNLA